MVELVVRFLDGSVMGLLQVVWVTCKKLCGFLLSDAMDLNLHLIGYHINDIVEKVRELHSY